MHYHLLNYRNTLYNKKTDENGKGKTCMDVGVVCILFVYIGLVAVSADDYSAWNSY